MDQARRRQGGSENAEGEQTLHLHEEQKTISVPVTREEVFIIEKVPVIIEEVRIGRRLVRETRLVTETVRREVLRVEHEGNSRVAEQVGAEHGPASQ